MESKGPSIYAPTTSSVDLSRSIDEDSLVDGPLISVDALHSAIRREFQPLPTPCHASLLSILHVVYVVLSLCVGLLCELKFGQEEVCTRILGAVEGDSAILFGKVFLWVLVLLFTACAQRHHSRARSRGYLRFYRKMQGLKYLPVHVHSAGNVLLLLVIAARMSPTVHTSMLLSILGLELLVSLPCLFYYTVKVIQFNRERAPPDVSQEENPHIPSETGFREGSNLEEVVEKQADLIEYLKQHNTLLSKRLLDLTAQH
ncbi:transmembrane protein 192 [Takifugu rubripes]|uniref:Transmembrane protein 192 n=1 Tax=Takifugu rubripes TaxID=31033 RepID=H2UQM0_TAKRU|nr:transmembrane protein 192 [Takifugu rubripes]|eukprot:XP_003972519.1 PREDICTED: transmembrane protein 192 [Takifugu rubripes]